MRRASFARAVPIGAAALAVAAVAAGAVGGIASGGHGSSDARTTARATKEAGIAYLAIATAGNTRLDTDFDRLHGPDRGDLAAARHDLRDIAHTEHLFDAQLAALTLPPAPERWARTLISVNEARATLTGQAATSTTPAGLAAYQQRLTAADVPVEQAVRTIRADLGLPAPATD